MQQNELNKVAVIDTATKNANNWHVKLEKAAASFDLFKSGVNMSKEAWSDITYFFLPVFDKKRCTFQFNSIKQNNREFKTFESVHGSKWDV